MMKFIFKSSLVVLFLSGCGLKEQNIQKQNIAYLQISSSKTYDVLVNDNLSFKTQKGVNYEIPSGLNHLKIYENSKLVYQKDIFLGTDSTKIINLP